MLLVLITEWLLDFVDLGKQFRMQRWNVFEALLNYDLIFFLFSLDWSLQLLPKW